MGRGIITLIEMDLFLEGQNDANWRIISAVNTKAMGSSQGSMQCSAVFV